MKKISLLDLMNQRKPLSHVMFIAFSLVMSILASLSGKFSGSPFDFIGTFLLIFFQLEVFIFLGNKLFANLSFDRSPGEITRIIILRFAAFMAGCLLSALILFIIIQYIFTIIRGEPVSDVLPNFIHTGIREWFLSTITGLSGGALIFMILLWQSSLRREQKLREENLIFQNETLKNQINPHFLFNSLNTLSSLISSRPETAEKFLNKLSAIYRYILENSRKDRVPLVTELNFINDYFELHKIRDVSFRCRFRY
jgi:two-component system LytT family sensor kinase